MAKQAVKYQTTTIEASQSAAEIAEMVRRYGASRFELRWDDAGQLSGIRFSLRTEELSEAPVTLSARTERILELLREDQPYNSRRRASATEWETQLRAQAHRIAWRHIRDLTEQLLLAVQLGLRTVGSAFMADIEVWDDATGETVPMAEFLARRVQLVSDDRGIRLLTGGEASRG